MKSSNGSISQYVLGALLDGGPKNMDEAHDMLWILAGDIAEKQKEIEALKNLANRKVLTGLLNKRGFNEEIDKEQNRVDRGQSTGGVIVSIDLAGFKRINDTYSMETGDQALSKFAEVLSAFPFRDTDVLANPGGDEFIIIMNNATLDYPRSCDGPSDHFSQTSGVWGKINRLNDQLRNIPFHFEYDDSKTGERQSIAETISARMSVSTYNAQTPVRKALSDADEKAKLIKKFTKQYVPGGR